jgi:hypothetical protein
VNRRHLLLAFAAAGALAAAAAGAAALNPRDPVCARRESARVLDLRSPADVAHLQDDLETIRAAADTFSEAVAKRPIVSDSADAQAGARAAPMRARAWCEAVLEQQVARTHGLSPDDVRRHRSQN